MKPVFLVFLSAILMSCKSGGSSSVRGAQASDVKDSQKVKNDAIGLANTASFTKCPDDFKNQLLDEDFSVDEPCWTLEVDKTEESQPKQLLEGVMTIQIPEKEVSNSNPKLNLTEDSASETKKWESDEAFSYANKAISQVDTQSAKVDDSSKSYCDGYDYQDSIGRCIPPSDAHYICRDEYRGNSGKDKNHSLVEYHKMIECKANKAFGGKVRYGCRPARARAEQQFRDKCWEKLCGFLKSKHETGSWIVTPSFGAAYYCTIN